MEVTQAVTKRQWGLRGVVERALVVPPAPFDLAPPAWAAALVEGCQRSVVAREAPVSVSVRETARFTLVSARAAQAKRLGDADFQQSVAEVYGALGDVIRSRPNRCPVRFWNHIPDIRHSENPGTDRYMAFNAGRFAACSAWFGSPDQFDRLLPTASAVGHAGPDLVVHVMAGDADGRSIENPRQTPSYRYSQRYGPRPPCFARATAVTWDEDGATTILVGGTASIRGEETMHAGNLRGQTAETLENLSALVRAAGCEGLCSFEALRVYYVHEADRRTIERSVADAFRHLTAIEYVRADLCRPDLLVEIEGVARAKR